MKLDYPHIIKEGPVRYELGQPNGDYIIYDFNKIITYLNVKENSFLEGNLKFTQKTEKFSFHYAPTLLKTNQPAKN